MCERRYLVDELLGDGLVLAVEDEGGACHRELHPSQDVDRKGVLELLDEGEEVRSIVC